MAGNRGWGGGSAAPPAGERRKEKPPEGGQSSNANHAILFFEVVLRILRGVFDVLGHMLGLALRLIHLAFGLGLGVTGEATNSILHRAFSLVPFACHLLAY